MTFLNPLLLFGLAAAAIPVILHLLNLRRLRTVDFSTLAFLRELQQSRIRRLKLRQILLLVVRTLMVAFLVLAFARPALRGSLPAGFGAAAGSTVAIVLDDSYSMTAADEAGERFTQARKAAAGIVSLLRPGDAAWLVRLSDLPRITIDPPTHDPALLLEAIDRSRPSAVRRPLGDGLAAAAALMARSKDVNREIYLIGDFQRTSLSSGPTPAAGAGGDAPAGTAVPQRTGPPESGAPPPATPGVRVYIVEVGTGGLPNVAVDSVAVLSRIFEKHRPVSLSARIRNFGGETVRDAVVSVYAAGTRVAQSNVTIEPGASETMDLAFVPGRSGFIAGTVTVERDELEMDNERHFAFAVPERIRVFVASGSPGEDRFLVPALRAGSAGDGESSLQVAAGTAAGLARADLREHDVVFLCGAAGLDRAGIDRLRHFVTDGGGLAVFPGPGDGPGSPLGALLAAMELPVVRGVHAGDGGAAGLLFREIDADHPLFAAIFERGARVDDPRRLSPRMLRALDLRAPPRGRQVITLGNGGGFLVEQPVGSGRVAVFAASASLGGGDFPMKGIFAPLVYRTAVFLATGSERPEQFPVGSEAAITVRDPGEIPAGTRFGLHVPGGAEEFITPSPTGGGLQFRTPPLGAPGPYRLSAGTRTLSLFAANLDTRDSDLERASGAEVDSFLASRGFDDRMVDRLPAGDRLPERITEARFGTELWRYCLGLVLLLALAEMAMGRRAGGEGGAAGG